MKKYFSIVKNFLHSHANIFFWCSILAIISFKLWLVAGIHLQADGGAVDDYLYVQEALSIIQGRWLGDYSFTTLVKGVGYPLWLALNYATRLPLLLSEQLLYIGALFFIFVALRPLAMSRAIKFFLFIILLFSPVTFAGLSMTSVNRAGIYAAITLLTFFSFFGMILRLNDSTKTVCIWSVFAGFFLTFFLNVREEGIWIIPCLLLLLMFACLMKKTGTISGKHIFISIGTPLMILSACTLLLATINLKHYGVFLVNEIKSPNFLSAYNALTRIEDYDKNYRVPVTMKMMRIAYSASPSFKKLQPYLDGSIGAVSREVTCKNIAICDEIGGGWFMWTLRESVAKAGYYSSAATAQEFYRNLAKEIKKACDEKTISCVPPNKFSRFLPPFQKEQLEASSYALISLGSYLIGFNDFIVGPFASTSYINILKDYTSLTHEEIEKPGIVTNGFTIGGWVFSFKGSVSITIQDEEGRDISFRKVVYLSPDIQPWYEKNYPSLILHTSSPQINKARFYITINCSRSECARYSLIFSKEGVLLKKISLNEILEHGLSMNSNDLNFNLESAGYYDSSFQGYWGKVQKGILTKIVLFYQFLSPVIFVISLSGSIIIFYLHLVRKVTQKYFFLLTSVGTAILSLLILLALIHGTSFPILYTHYFAPLYGLLEIFYIFSLAGVAEYFLKRRLDNSEEA